MKKLGFRRWICKDGSACASVSNVILRDRSNAHSTPDDAFRLRMTDYVKWRAALESFAQRTEKLAADTTRFCESLASVSQSMSEANALLSDVDTSTASSSSRNTASSPTAEDDLAFAQHAHLLFRFCTLYSETVRRRVTEPIREKLKTFNLHEKSLGARRRRKIEHDRVFRSLVDIREVTKALRRKVLARVVDANDLDVEMRRERPEQMKDLDRLESEHARLKRELGEETHTCETVLRHMRAQSRNLARRVFDDVKSETSRLMDEASRLLGDGGGCGDDDEEDGTKKYSRRRRGGRRRRPLPVHHHFSSPPRITKEQQRVLRAPREREQIVSKRREEPKMQRHAIQNEDFRNGLRKTFQKSTMSVVRDSNLSETLSRALNMNVDVGIDDWGHLKRGSGTRKRRTNKAPHARPVSVAPLPPPRVRVPRKRVARPVVSMDAKDEGNHGGGGRGGEYAKEQENAKDAGKVSKKEKVNLDGDDEDYDSGKKTAVDSERKSPVPPPIPNTPTPAALARDSPCSVANAETVAKNAHSSRSGRSSSGGGGDETTTSASTIETSTTNVRSSSSSTTTTKARRPMSISVGTRVEIVFGKRLGKVGRVISQGNISGRWRVRVGSKQSMVVEYPARKLRPLSHNATGAVGSPIVGASPSPRRYPSAPSRSSNRGVSRRRKKKVRSVRPKTPGWLLKEMAQQA